MALATPTTFSASFCTRLHTARCTFCTTSSSSTTSSSFSRLSFPSYSPTSLAKLRSSSPASCLQAVGATRDSISGSYSLAGAPCHTRTQQRGEPILGSDFLSSKVWNRRIVGRRWHPSQHSAARGVGIFQVRAARMESGNVKVGFKAPDFELPEPLTGKTVKLEDFEDQQGLLVMFICNHCPFVKHLKEGIAKLAKEYSSKGLGIVAISSNSVVTHPQDGPQLMAEDAKKFGYVFPYLYDETQEIAKSFGAVCTPDFFLFKKDGRRPFELVYHGRFDETRPGQTPVTGRDLRAAVDGVLKGLPAKSDQRPSIGCSIKWHPGK